MRWINHRKEGLRILELQVVVLLVFLCRCHLRWFKILKMDKMVTMKMEKEKNRRKERNKLKDIMISLQFFKRRNLEIF